MCLGCYTDCLCDHAMPSTELRASRYAAPPQNRTNHCQTPSSTVFSRFQYLYGRWTNGGFSHFFWFEESFCCLSTHRTTCHWFLALAKNKKDHVVLQFRSAGRRGARIFGFIHTVRVYEYSTSGGITDSTRSPQPQVCPFDKSMDREYSYE